MKEISFKITSAAGSSLLMNNVESMTAAKAKPSRTKADEWEQTDEMFEARQYRENGQLVLPARMWKAALKDAARVSGIKQSGKRSNYKSLVSAMIVIPNSLKLDQSPADLRRQEDYVKMKATQGRILRLRPALDTWSGTLDLVVLDESQFPSSIVIELLKFAGQFIGVGDYRPEYGRFNVSER